MCPKDDGKYLSKVRLNEGLSAETMTNAHSEMVQNAFTTVPRLLAGCSQVLLQWSGNAWEDRLGCIRWTQLYCRPCSRKYPTAITTAYIAAAATSTMSQNYVLGNDIRKQWSVSRQSIQTAVL